jgi:hypothetical protein
MASVTVPFLAQEIRRRAARQIPKMLGGFGNEAALYSNRTSPPGRRLVLPLAI